MSIGPRLDGRRAILPPPGRPSPPPPNTCTARRYSRSSAGGTASLSLSGRARATGVTWGNSEMDYTHYTIQPPTIQQEFRWRDSGDKTGVSHMGRCQRDYVLCSRPHHSYHMLKDILCIRPTLHLKILDSWVKQQLCCRSSGRTTAVKKSAARRRETARDIGRIATHIARQPGTANNFNH